MLLKYFLLLITLVQVAELIGGLQQNDQEPVAETSFTASPQLDQAGTAATGLQQNDQEPVAETSFTASPQLDQAGTAATGLQQNDKEPVAETSFTASPQLDQAGTAATASPQQDQPSNAANMPTASPQQDPARTAADIATGILDCVIEGGLCFRDLYYLCCPCEDPPYLFRPDNDSVPESGKPGHDESEDGEQERPDSSLSDTSDGSNYDADDERSLRAVRDFDARLPCGQGKIFLDGPDAYVMWLKDDEKFLYRFPNEDTWAKTLNPNNIYGTSCIDDDHCYDDTSLFLPKVGEKDAGNYRCRVHYQGSSSVDYVINLRIVDPIGTPKLIDERGEQIVTPYVGPLTLGSNLTLICQVVITDPPTTVVWLRNGETVRSIVSDRPGLFRERLEIVDATRNELDAHYQCTASNADVTDAMTASVVVKMYLPPLKIEIRVNNNYDFEVGQPRVVDCVVVGCVPTPTINWYIGGKLVKASAHKELHDGNYTVSSLTLTASMRDNGKWLSCRVHNAYLPTVYEDNVTLHVGYRPVRSNDQIPTIGVVPGEPQTLTCTVLSSETPSQFRWTFTDSRMINTDPVKIEGSVNSYSTRLSWVPQASDLGLLQCFAINQFGEQKEPCQYHIVLGGPPETPKCSPSEDNSNSSVMYDDMRKLFCQTGWDGGRPQTVHLRIENHEGKLVHNDTDPRGNFTLPSFLGKATNHTAKVFATNTWGQSTVRTLKLNYTKQNTEENDTQFGLSMYGFAALGALSAVLLGSTVLFKTCSDPKDKKNQGAVRPGTLSGSGRARRPSGSVSRELASRKRASGSKSRLPMCKGARIPIPRSRKTTARLSPIPEADEESFSTFTADVSDWTDFMQVSEYGDSENNPLCNGPVSGDSE